jgi:TPR repeat protein
MPISRRPARTSAGRYAILGVALVATLAGGGWLVTEFSQRPKTSALERSAGVQTPATDRAAPAAPGQAAPAVSDAIRAEIDLARAGDAKAQYNLATAYAEGKGIARNYPKALEWFTKSANAGVGASQYSLAAIYESGLVNGKPDLAQARAWYEKAAAQGDTKATERLALMGKVPSADRTASTNAAAPVPSTATAILKAVGRQEIREIQSLLVQMNFNPGPADGQMGSKTADAIRLYQQFAGIKIDGVPGQELLDEMRAVASSMSSGG